jgi:hypothetical protein
LGDLIVGFVCSCSDPYPNRERIRFFDSHTTLGHFSWLSGGRKWYW